MRLYLALLHYPVLNKHRERIASAITTFDLHDISRLAKTYRVKKFFVITPLEDQQRLVERVVRHWTLGYGATYNPDRKDAFELLAISPSLERCTEGILEMEGESPLLIATDASQQNGNPLGYPDAAGIIYSNRVVVLLFGTAWGLDRQIFNLADYVLDPIDSGSGYNHLSVRSAAAIILDRLAGGYPKG